VHIPPGIFHIPFINIQHLIAITGLDDHYSSHPLSLLLIPVMESSGQSGASKQVPIDKPAYVYETLRASRDYSAFEAEVICPIIRGTHQQSYIYPSKFPKLLLPISYASPHRSVESICRLILETDYNHPSQDITCPHYIAPSPNQSAHVPITRHILVSGNFRLKYPGYFMVTN
jgi:hypothetical protein